jgi:hypothetical protein
MRDEIKVRLPDVLDGNYRVEFTLFSVVPSSRSGVTLTPVSEASVPLSSSGSRDAKSGLRVATVIPNGKHRLELGGFQLQLETRLLSSLHVGDPSVSAVLRDINYGSEQPAEETHFPISRTLSSSSALDNRTDFSSTLLASSSDSTVVGYFQVLLYVHLFNLLDRRENKSAGFKPETCVGETIGSLFQVLRKVKSKYLTKPSRECTEDDLTVFFKMTVDIFDEACLSQSSNETLAQTSDEEKELRLEPFSDTIHLDASVSQEDGGSEDERAEEGNDGAAVSIRSKARSRRDSREARIIMALGSAGIPFSRVAYGASKTDRMRAEAELRHDSTHFAPFFDDDETIATAPSMYTGVRRSETPGAFSFDDSQGIARQGAENVHDISDNNSIARSGSSTAHPGIGERHRSIGNTEFAKRVKTAAQAMLAPCVAPSLSSMLSSRGPSPRNASSMSPSAAKCEDGRDNTIVAAVSISVVFSFSCLPFLTPWNYRPTAL